ncbi:hypothetical protein [Paraburkholderia pallida]|uniref:Uncharacterized protein n=1 Tax=Paraburkholderia pallida TaxID=2547399 RepID=A0A4V1B0U1_9BURK|nr:hypothetical protein [Paraburkholderia pallida]QBR03953.1 hypothetical protein E1956_42860 [Paraburkholderia pallida]
MDIGAVMNTMRDPAGIPAQPVIFQVLMVLTWVLHIAFVHLALGSAGLAIYAFHRRAAGGDWARLSMAMTKVAKVCVSLLIVLGVAPLLFTQVIYDPQWYTSNVLSGRWAIAFIFTLIVGYCCWFAFYHANREQTKRQVGCYAWVALLLFCLDGLIMHALSYQALLPAKWMSWYAPGGVVDTRGAALHAIQWPRYVFIMGLSVPAVGVYLIAYAHYFAPRTDREAGYLAFARNLGKRIARWGFALSMLPMLAWQLDLPAGTGLVAQPVGWLILAGLALMAIWSGLLSDRTNGYMPAAGGLLLLSLLALWREIVRIRYLRPFGYDIRSYHVNPDWPSTVLFFLTLAGIGGLVGGFYLTLLYQAGRNERCYDADRYVARLATGAVSVLGVWIAAFFAYGFVISVRDSFN